MLGPRDLVVTGGTALAFSPDERIASAANSVFSIDARGWLVGRYDKAHLVPYGEVDVLTRELRAAVEEPNAASTAAARRRHAGNFTWLRCAETPLQAYRTAAG